MSATIDPGATLGVLGGGQLGRMFTQAARAMGYEVAIFAPEETTPAGAVATRQHTAAYTDGEALESFASQVEVVTYEFENIATDVLSRIERHAPLRPSHTLLSACQERSQEKAALIQLGLPVAPHALITSAADFAAAERVGFPGVLKTAAWGYDGKGQRKVSSREELPSAWQELSHARCVYEAWVPFEGEFSVVAARGMAGDCQFYHPFWNEHRHHILDLTHFPAPISERTLQRAHDITRAILEGFDVCGVLCVEFFYLGNDELMVNEIAPRTHNSGHITMDAHVTSQFEQQVRAICGLPLGSVEPVAPAGAMANLLGDVWSGGEPRWSQALADSRVALHLYGKAGARPGRKMGHLNVTAASAEDAIARARAARDSLISS